MHGRCRRTSSTSRMLSRFVTESTSHGAMETPRSLCLQPLFIFYMRHSRCRMCQCFFCWLCALKKFFSSLVWWLCSVESSDGTSDVVKTEFVFIHIYFLSHITCKCFVDTCVWPVALTRHNNSHVPHSQVELDTPQVLRRPHNAHASGMLFAVGPTSLVH